MPTTPYDEYMKSDAYHNAYPAPSEGTLRHLVTAVEEQHKLHPNKNITLLDFGAGEGRYAAALLKTHPYVDVIAYDICTEGLGKLAKQLRNTDINLDRYLITNDWNKVKQAVKQNSPVNVAAALFGVIGLVGNKEQRATELRKISNVLANDGKILLEVPNSLRRFVSHGGENSQGKRRPFPLPRTVKLHRTFQDPETKNVQTTEMKYQLYTPKKIHRELTKNGFTSIKKLPTSILREKDVSRLAQAAQSGNRIAKLAASFEAKLSSKIPASFGYGILIECSQNQSQSQNDVPEVESSENKAGESYAVGTLLKNSRPPSQTSQSQREPLIR